jgi:hypothetical protein
MAAGEMHRSDTMVVYPAMQPLTFSALKVRGGTPVVVTVTLSQQAAEGSTVKLSSDHPALVSMPAEVQVPAGANRRVSDRDPCGWG